MTPEQYEPLAQWAYTEFTNMHESTALSFKTVVAKMSHVEERLEAVEGRLATVAAEVTQIAVTVNRVAEVAQSAKSQARTDNRGTDSSRVTPPHQRPDSLPAIDLPLPAGEPCL